jgi:FMN reductase
MSVLLVAGSPSERSRTAALLQAAGLRLSQLGATVSWLSVRELPAQALLHADFAHPRLVQAVAQVAESEVLVVATPVYKAAYSGILKTFLDLLPQTALKGKTILPLATGGSPHHMLALDYALRPVLQSLGAKHILPGIYATDTQLVLQPEGGYQIADDIRARLEEAVASLIEEGLRIPPLHGFDAIDFADVRCCV